MKFGQALLRHAPLPQLIIHLDTTPAACLARCPEAALGLDDHEALDKSVRDAVRLLAAKGCECVRGSWDGSPKASAAIRDLVLCASPFEQSKAMAPPSDAAVDRLMEDLWAASQPPRLRASPTMAMRSFPRSSSQILTPTSPAVRAPSRQTDEHSPVSILARMG